MRGWRLKSQSSVAVGGPVAEPFHAAADGRDGGAEPERVEHLDPVGPQGDAGADRPELAGLVEDPYPMPRSLQRPTAVVSPPIPPPTTMTSRSCTGSAPNVSD